MTKARTAYTYTYPIYQEEILNEIGFRYYLNDIYSLQKSIYAIDKKHINASKGDLET